MRILFVAMPGSVHAARWIQQVRGQKWDLHLFPSDDGTVHPDLSGVTIHRLIREPEGDVNAELQQTGLLWPFPRGRARVTHLIHKRLLSRSRMLAQLVERLQPDLVHTMEMQRGGYLTLEARGESDALRTRPWLYTCWGSDIYSFGRKPEHEPLVRGVLQSCDFFLADCQRDLYLARQYGFTGVDFGPLPGGGGFEIASMQRFNSGPPSNRNVIAVKGYQGDIWGGRAVIALQALKLCADSLKDYQTVIYSAQGDKQVLEAAQHLSNIGVRISILPQSNHDELVKLMGRARVALALSTTDGTPNTMLEAMIMGAFPIQSDTVSTGEWINDGQNGFLVPPEDPEYAADTISRALSDDDLVDRAAEMNRVLMRSKVDISLIQPRVIRMYEQVANWKRTTSSHKGELCES